MFAYEPPLEPSCDEWREYVCPELCKSRIKDICQDILRVGSKTRWDAIYDAIYELVQADIEEEHLEKNLGEEYESSNFYCNAHRG